MVEVFLTSREPFSQLQIVRVGFRPARLLSVSWEIRNSAGVVSTRTEDICEARLISHTHAYTPGQRHLNVVSVQHVFSSIFLQGHVAVLHPEPVLRLQSWQSGSKANIRRNRRCEFCILYFIVGAMSPEIT